MKKQARLTSTTAHFAVQPRAVHYEADVRHPPQGQELRFGTIRQFLEVDVRGHKHVLVDAVIYTKVFRMEYPPFLWYFRPGHHVRGVFRAADIGDPMAFGTGVPERGFLSPAFTTIIPCVPRFVTDCSGDECFCDK
jgi:hypothetical protein